MGNWLTILFIILACLGHLKAKRAQDQADKARMECIEREIKHLHIRKL